MHFFNAKTSRKSTFDIATSQSVLLMYNCVAKLIFAKRFTTLVNANNNRKKTTELN